MLIQFEEFSFNLEGRESNTDRNIISYYYASTRNRDSLN